MTRRFNHPLARIASAAPLVLVLLALAPAAQAQDRFARRAHMELSFAPGWGFSLGEPSDSSSGSCGSLYCGFGSAPPPTDAGLSLTTDLRVLAPEGVGFALRVGVEWGVIVLEPGAAYTLDLHAGTEGGVAACSGAHRAALATHPLHTFAATVSHLASAVRKLAATATAEESSAPLWRGVRGELKPSWDQCDPIHNQDMSDHMLGYDGGESSS